MSNLSKKTAWALVIGLALVQVFPVAADLLVCIDDRTDRGCCDESPARDMQGESTARLLEGADCGCCIRVDVVSRTADATVQKIDTVGAVESGGARVHVASIARRLATACRDEPDNARLPSLRTVVLLI